MSGPRQQSGSSAGGMETAARVHGGPILRMNNLSRWYLRTGLILLLFVTVVPLLEALTNAFLTTRITYSNTRLPALIGSVFLVTGGIGIKFFPSSFGGSPHLYSQKLALWSYWLILGGVSAQIIAATFFPIFFQLSLQSIYYVVHHGGHGLVFIGGGLLLYNLWHTMQNRVS